MSVCMCAYVCYFVFSYVGDLVVFECKCVCFFFFVCGCVVVSCVGMCGCHVKVWCVRLYICLLCCVCTCVFCFSYVGGSVCFFFFCM